MQAYGEPVARNPRAQGPDGAVTASRARERGAAIDGRNAPEEVYSVRPHADAHKDADGTAALHG